MEELVNRDCVDMTSTIRKCIVRSNFLQSNSTSHVDIFGAIAELIDNARDAMSSERVDTACSIKSPSSYSQGSQSPAPSNWSSKSTSPFSEYVVSQSPAGRSLNTTKLPPSYPRVIKPPSSSNDSILQIDMSEHNSTRCLVFTDNGCGMDESELYAMFCFGSSGIKGNYTDKTERIGRYGNGFKSGSMRIGKDVVVLTICKESWCIGLLSQTYLEAIGAKDVLVPIVTFDKDTKKSMNADTEQLEVITKHSIFKHPEEIIDEFKGLKSTIGKNETGTRILIYNLVEGQLDFDIDEHDIINCDANITLENEMNSNYRRSLREYCSILYLPKSSKLSTVRTPKMKIYLRDRLVHPKDMTTILKHQQQRSYKHKNHEAVTIIFGCTPDKNPYDYGMMLYHKKRFIKYLRAGFQKSKNDDGVGVVGVVDVEPLMEPVHNKQDFDISKSYTTVVKEFDKKLKKYWDDLVSTNKRKRKTDTSSAVPVKRSSNKSSKQLITRTEIGDDLDLEPDSPVPEESNIALPGHSHSPVAGHFKSPTPRSTQSMVSRPYKSGTSKLPVAGTSRSPVAGTSRTPVAGTSRSPVAGTSRSPVSSRSDSPVAGHSKSPVSSGSQSPVSNPSQSTSRRPDSPSSTPSEHDNIRRLSQQESEEEEAIVSNLTPRRRSDRV